MLVHASTPDAFAAGAAFAFGRAFAFNTLHLFAFKMAAVFMLTTSTLVLQTGFAARWVGVLGYVAAGCLLVASDYFDWILIVFPA